MNEKPTYEELEHRVKELEQAVSERKLAEKKLKDSEDRFRNIIESSPMGVHMYRLKHGDQLVFMGANPAADDILGVDNSQFIGKTIEAAFPALAETEVPERYRKACSEGEDWHTEQIEYKDEQIEGAFEVYAFQTAPNSMAAFFLDITERKRAEEKLKESEEKYRTIFDNASEGITVTQDGVGVFINRRMLEITGTPARELDQLSGRTFESFFHPEDREILAERYARRIRGEKVPSTYSIRLLKRNGEPIWVDISPSLISWEGKPALLTFITDITERKRAEEALRLSEERYRSILESIEDGYYEVNLTGDISFCNDSFLKIFGCTRDEMMGQNYKDFLDERYAKQAYEIFNKVYTSGIPSSGFEHEIKRKDGSYRFIDISTTLLTDSEDRKIGFRGIVRDITERKQAEAEKEKLESQLHQAYKMEAVGTLAGGIAHDFNNILGIIVGNAELAIDDVPEWNPAQLNLKEIRKASLRARDVVKQILTFSRQTEPTMKPVAIGPIIEESLRLLRSSIPTTIDIQHHITADPDTVNADATQINQILLNLCTNAAHAMRETGGILRVDLENLTIDQVFSRHSHNLNPGEYLKLTVSDTGQGMDSETLERIFDPYFTTKEVGQGTGMGLAVVHGIVINHKGEIWADSIPGKGTTFNIVFPLVNDKIAKVDEPKVSIPGGEERILFIDDEVAIVNMVQSMLNRLGYQVTSKTSSSDALEAFRQESDAFDLVITDQTMPKMTGKDLARELMKIKPDLPVIICTGFSEQIDEERAKEMGVSALIMKPVVISELAGVIRDVLKKKRI